MFGRKFLEVNSIDNFSILSIKVITAIDNFDIFILKLSIERGCCD